MEIDPRAFSVVVDAVINELQPNHNNNDDPPIINPTHSSLSHFLLQQIYNTMAWRSSGGTNDEMVDNLKRTLIKKQVYTNNAVIVVWVFVRLFCNASS